MSFNDGTAEARVMARYAEFGTREELGALMAETQRQEQLAGAIKAKLAADRGATVTNIRRASDKAIAYLVALSNERSTVAEDVARAWAESADRADVSAKIDWLKDQPKLVNSGVGTESYDVPAGRYAVRYEIQGAPKTVFLKVSRPTDGPFAGRVFVNIQAGDELHRVAPAARDLFLRMIEEAGLAEASKLYGREIGSCGVCGRTLTDEDSRTAGIGPKCAAKTGW